MKFKLDKKIFVFASGIALAATIMKGNINSKSNNNTQSKSQEVIEQTYGEEQLSTKEELFENIFSNASQYYSNRGAQKDTFKPEDLISYTTAKLVIKDDTNYTFLNKMPNLEKLIITDKSTEPKLSNIDGSVFNKNIIIELQAEYETSPINEERYGFLKEIPNIETLIIGTPKTTANVDWDFIQSLKNVHNLELGISLKTNFKYKDLTHL